MGTLRLDQMVAAVVFIAARVSGLMVFCPFFGNSAIPAPLKAGITMLITILLYPIRGPLRLDLGLWQWAGVATSEVAIGLALGLTANFMMEAALLAGQSLGVQMGYSLAALFDPTTQAETPVLAQFHQLAALLIFLQCGVHHWLLRAIVRSFAYLPAGTPIGIAALSYGLLRAAEGIFLSGLQIAAPVLAATLVADVALGFLAKASPQMPVLFIGLAVKNLMGLAMLTALMTYWPQSFSQRFADSIALAERLLHLAR
jgi:flagellar biosynthesis protein FliR